MLNQRRRAVADSACWSLALTRGRGGGRGLLDDFLPMIAEKIATVVECKVNRRDAWVNETQGIRMLNVRGWYYRVGSVRMAQGGKILTHEHVQLVPLVGKISTMPICLPYLAHKQGKHPDGQKDFQVGGN